jgi:hypothetical protein
MEQGRMSEWFEVPSLNTSFVTDVTLARCFDTRGIEFHTVVWGSGLLKFLVKQEDEKVFYAVDPTCLPECHYVFDGEIWTGEWVDHAVVTIPVHSEGDSDGHGFEEPVIEGSPWEMESSVEMYVPYSEWQERLDLCRGCKQYDHKKGICKVDKVLVASRANRSLAECPKGVWGVSDTFDEAEYRRRQAAAAEMIGATSTEPSDQSDFEAEWEARRAGK